VFLEGLPSQEAKVPETAKHGNGKSNLFCQHPLSLDVIWTSLGEFRVATFNKAGKFGSSGPFSFSLTPSSLDIVAVTHGNIPSNYAAVVDRFGYCIFHCYNHTYETAGKWCMSTKDNKL
jgi:hypothetical protein